ncbi:DMT family transporter [Microbacterium paraoxydans]|uniref:DMT family transporter n=1 Tax=Microbacterium paraoxydans TaxID=199592 RepID=UPI002011F13F|nr:DMT family transporter [Microbacterium paraoxydans]
MSKQIGIVRGAVTVTAAVAFVITWSSGFLIAAFGTVDVSALTLLVWRFVPLAVVLLAVVIATGAARGVTPRELGTQAAIGLFAQFGYCAAVYGAVASGIATGTVALIDAVQPLVVAALVGPILGLRVRGAQWAGLALGALGVALVVHSQFGSSSAPPAAYLLPAAAMVCLVIGTLLQRRSPVRTGMLVTLTVHLTVTAVLLLGIALVTGDLVPPAAPGFWLAVVLAAVFPTLAAYGLYWWLLRRVGITALQALLFLIAPATALAGALLLGEPLTALTVIGFALCGGGVAVVLAGERQERAEATAEEPESSGERRTAQGRTRTARPSNATTSPSCS